MINMKNEKQKEYRKNNNNLCTKKYEKTVNGFLMRMYRNMKSRVVGVQKNKYHLYKGKEILDKNIFYEFAKSNHDFIKLFLNWEHSKYERRLTPSVDRIDPIKGYTLDNIQFITHSENSRRGALNKSKIV